MNWIEHGSIVESDSVHNTDRPRAIAAAVFLLELVGVYWFSAALISSVPAGPIGARAGTFLMPVAPALVWPVARDEDPSLSISNPTEEDLASKQTGIGAEGSLPTGIAEGDSPVGAATAPDDVRIVSVFPSPTIPLWVGDIVNFQVTVEYNLASSNSSTLVLLIDECTCEPREAGPIPLALAQPDAPIGFQARFETTIEKGRRSQTVTKQIRVPVAGALLLSAHLGGASTRAFLADSRRYGIMDAGKPAVGTRSSVKIVSIEPAPSSLVYSGDKLDLEIIVDYNLTEEKEVLHITVNGGDSTSIASFDENIKKGQRRLVIREPVTVPETRPSSSSADKITVTVRLGESELLDSVSFKVSRR